MRSLKALVVYRFQVLEPIIELTYSTVSFVPKRGQAGVLARGPEESSSVTESAESPLSTPNRSKLPTWIEIF